jgi:hypothetical protein
MTGVPGCRGHSFAVSTIFIHSRLRSRLSESDRLIELYERQFSAAPGPGCGRSTFGFD